MNLKFSLLLKKFSVLVLIFSFLFSPFGISQAKGGRFSYTVKLVNANFYNELSKFGDDINLRFSTSVSPQFQNIYTFSSAYPLVELRQHLAGKFIYLEPEMQVKASGVVVNDPGFTSDSQNIDKQWGLIKTGYDVAWEKTIGSKSNIVAIVDTGVDETHQDLSTINFVPGFDFINNKAITVGTNSDDNGHGTLVAGVLGATANNGVGVVGSNWQIGVMPIKALDSSGKGDADTLAESIVWAADHGAQFLNLSVGGIGFGHDTALADAISYAFNKNIVIVAASGNDTASTGVNLDLSPVFPVCDDNNYNMVIGVAAVDQNDIKPDFSNYGKNCVDVSAPGKRILSTINFDPISKKPSPNSYAYASGTSLAVPFVVGEAALIKALYPTATNVQIRDRIISTADNIDNLNLSQCNGSSCRGLLGAGRINVAASLAVPISQATSNLKEGDLVKDQDTGAVYEILGGQKRLVSAFVQNEKFLGVAQKLSTSVELAVLPDGPYVTPAEGSLVKYDARPTVYQISNGQKLPITGSVFKQRNFSYANINTLSLPELDSWTTGNFVPPIDGTLLRTIKNKTVYWVVGGTLHPINYGFYTSRGLNIFPVMAIPDSDIAGYAKGEPYIR